MNRAWADLPAADRDALKMIRAEQWEVTDQPLGVYADGCRPREYTS